MIYDKNDNLKAIEMGLTYAGVYLQDSKLLNEYYIISGSKLYQEKGSLQEG